MEKNLFDNFTWHSRVMPVVVIVLPIIIYSILKGYISGEWMITVSSSFFIMVPLLFASKLIRELGKKCEEKMYEELKGKPTVIVMRFADLTVDILSKQRYHKVLREKLPSLKFPEGPDSEKIEHDNVYESAVRWLISHSFKNRDKEKRVYQELVEYNFWRNLYGAKGITLLLYSVVTITEAVRINVFSIVKIENFQKFKYLPFLFLCICIIFIFISVTSSTVKRRAFCYAKTLFEVCERI